MKNFVFMARDTEIFMSFLWRLRKYRRRSRSTGYRRYGSNRGPKKGQRSCARPEEGSVVALRATGGSSNDPILPEPA